MALRALRMAHWTDGIIIIIIIIIHWTDGKLPTPLNCLTAPIPAQAAQTCNCHC
jgi:hypothetical protein